MCVCVCVCCVRAAEFRAIWSQCTLRNDRMRDVTGLDFRPLDESVRDCVESLISVVRCLVNDHVVYACFLRFSQKRAQEVESATLAHFQFVCGCWVQGEVTCKTRDSKL